MGGRGEGGKGEHATVKDTQMQAMWKGKPEEECALENTRRNMKLETFKRNKWKVRRRSCRKCGTAGRRESEGQCPEMEIREAHEITRKQPLGRSMLECKLH